MPKQLVQLICKCPELVVLATVAKEEGDWDEAIRRYKQYIAVVESIMDYTQSLAPKTITDFFLPRCEEYICYAQREIEVLDAARGG